MKLTAFIVAATIALAPVSVSAQSLLSEEKLMELSNQVESLRTQLGDTTTIIADSRGQIEDLEYIITNSDAVAQKVKEDLDFIIKSLEVGSPNHQSLLEVDKQLTAKINEYSEAESDLLRETVAPQLVQRRDELKAIDERRDRIVADALKAQRMLEVSVRDIEGLILVNASAELVQVFTTMLDSAETTVNSALEVGNDLAVAAGLDSQ